MKTSAALLAGTLALTFAVASVEAAGGAGEAWNHQVERLRAEARVAVAEARVAEAQAAAKRLEARQKVERLVDLQRSGEGTALLSGHDGTEHLDDGDPPGPGSGSVPLIRGRSAPRGTFRLASDLRSRGATRASTGTSGDGDAEREALIEAELRTIGGQEAVDAYREQKKKDEEREQAEGDKIDRFLGGSRGR